MYFRVSALYSIVRLFRRFGPTTFSIFLVKFRLYEVCSKSNENDTKDNFILNIHAITLHALQNRLLAIEYSDSSFAATLHSSGGSLHLRCCSKPSSQLPGPFQLSQNDVL